MKALIIGGVKSGKTRFAESLAQASEKKVTVIATAQALDDEMAARIRQHKTARPKNWTVVEEPIALAAAIASQDANRFILIDCLTLWLTNLLMLEDEQRLAQERDAFLSALSSSSCQLALVSNETNMGVMPTGELSRRYCDEAGLFNQRVAELCDQVTLMVAGLPMHLKAQDLKGQEMVNTGVRGLGMKGGRA